MAYLGPQNFNVKPFLWTYVFLSLNGHGEIAIYKLHCSFLQSSESQYTLILNMSFPNQLFLFDKRGV